MLAYSLFTTLCTQEVIVNPGVYDFSLDMWSVGCVYGEMLMKLKQVKGGDHPGPLLKLAKIRIKEDNADNEEFETVLKLDHLEEIFNIIGKPPIEDIKGTTISNLCFQKSIQDLLESMDETKDGACFGRASQ